MSQVPPAPDPDRDREVDKPPWYRRTWVIVTAAVLVTAVIFSGGGDDDSDAVEASAGDVDDAYDEGYADGAADAEPGDAVDAYDDGYDDGLAAAGEDGYDDGYADGRADGLAEVDDATYDAGYDDGVASVDVDDAAGFEDGYDEGYADGLADSLADDDVDVGGLDAGTLDGFFEITFWQQWDDMSGTDREDVCLGLSFMEDEMIDAFLDGWDDGDGVDDYTPPRDLAIDLFAEACDSL